MPFITKLAETAENEKKSLITMEIEARGITLDKGWKWKGRQQQQ